MKAELGISFINKNEIPVKAPDGSPLDLFGFGYLKQRLCPEGPELWMVFGNFLRRYWSEIDIAQIQRVFNSWKRRLRLISARDGEHIEQKKGIHRRPFKA